MFKKFSIFIIFFSLFSLQLFGANTHYVNTATLKVRNAPNSKAYHSYSIYKNHKVKVYEVQDSWARISSYKTSTKDGKLVKTAKWVHADFLTPLYKEQEKVAPKVEVKKPEVPKVVIEEPKKEEVEEVVEVEVTPAPLDPLLDDPLRDDYALFKDVNPYLIQLISKSDDYEKYKPMFVSVSNRLVKEGICEYKDFSRANGWIEVYKDKIYFLYCGKIKRSNKIYFNAITGESTK